MKTKTDFPNKPFEIITSFLCQPRKKEKQPNSEPIFAQKATCSIITQIISHSSIENAQKLLNLIGSLIYITIRMLYNAKNTLELMDRFIQRHKKTRGMKIFTISTDTLNKYTDTIRPELSDEFLLKQADKLSSKSCKLGIEQKEISVAIDPTNKEYRGKYPNHCQPKGYVGQKERYPTAYSMQSIIDNTNQRLLLSTPKMKSNSTYKSTNLPSWIIDIQTVILQNAKQMKTIKVVYGDREYYQGVGFAFAALGWLLPSLSPEATPRLCVPRKLHNKHEKKKAFLLDPTRKEIETSYIELEFYKNNTLGDALNKFKHNKNKTKYEIPIAVVARFDAYSFGKKKKNLKYARKMAQEYEVQLTLITKELNQAIDGYDRFVKTLPRKYEKKKTNFGGKRRSKFKFPKEKPLYQLCCTLWDKRKRIKKKYSNLLKRLMFFSVSIRPNEDINLISEELMLISKGYHQRWMVENCFKSIKGQFWVSTKKRSLQARKAYFTISSLLYNAWHYQRLSRFKRKCKYSTEEVRSIKSWRKTEDKKKMQEVIRTESARAFLIETLGFGLETLLKQEILAL